MRKNNLISLILFASLFGVISFLPVAITWKYFFPVRIFLLVILAYSAIGKRRVFELSDWPLWVFVISMTCGIILAQDKVAARQAFFYFSFILLTMFFIGKSLYSEVGQRAKIALIICILGMVVSLVGIAELFLKSNIIYERWITNEYYTWYIGSRPISTQFNPVVLGSYLIFCLPFAFAISGSASNPLRRFGFLCMTLFIWVILATASRQVFLGFICLLLFYLCARGKKKMIVSLLLLLALMICFASFSKNANIRRFGFKRLVAGSYDSIVSEYRSKRMVMAWRMIKDYPVSGIGYEQIRSRFTDYCNPQDKQESWVFKILDNMYLTILAESGLIGFAGFMMFIFCVIRRGLVNNAVIPLAGFIGLLVNMGGYELFYWKNPYMLFCLLAGFVCARTT